MSSASTTAPVNNPADALTTRCDYCIKKGYEVCQRSGKRQRCDACVLVNRKCSLVVKLPTKVKQPTDVKKTLSKVMKGVPKVKMVARSGGKRTTKSEYVVSDELREAFMELMGLHTRIKKVHTHGNFGIVIIDDTVYFGSRWPLLHEKREKAPRKVAKKEEQEEVSDTESELSSIFDEADDIDDLSDGALEVF